MHSPVLNAVTELDPARALRAPGSPYDPELAAILQTDRRIPRTRTFHPVLVTSGLAVAASVTLVVTAPWSTPSAFATWTRVPSVVTSSVPAGLADQCAPVTLWPDASGELTVEAPVHPVLTEVRGDYTYVIQSGADAWSECLAVAGEEPGSWDVVENSALAPEGAGKAAPAADSILTLHDGTTSWASGTTGSGALTSAFGKAGREVTEVEVLLDDGTTARASVSRGWWAVWAPGGESLTGEATLTLSDGSTRPATVAATE